MSTKALADKHYIIIMKMLSIAESFLLLVPTRCNFRYHELLGEDRSFERDLFRLLCLLDPGVCVASSQGIVLTCCS